jgi:hypothetical protein
MRKLNSDLFTLKNFRLIFEYGNENSGQLMFDRFVKDYKRNEKAFIQYLCDIDMAKFDKFQKQNSIINKRQQGRQVQRATRFLTAFERIRDNLQNCKQELANATPQEPHKTRFYTKKYAQCKNEYAQALQKFKRAIKNKIFTMP